MKGPFVVENPYITPFRRLAGEGDIKALYDLRYYTGSMLDGPVTVGGVMMCIATSPIVVRSMLLSIMARRSIYTVLNFELSRFPFLQDSHEHHRSNRKLFGRIARWVMSGVVSNEPGNRVSGLLRSPMRSGTKFRMACPLSFAILMKSSAGQLDWPSCVTYKFEDRQRDMEALGLDLEAGSKDWLFRNEEAFFEVQGVPGLIHGVYFDRRWCDPVDRFSNYLLPELS